MDRISTKQKYAIMAAAAGFSGLLLLLHLIMGGVTMGKVNYLTNAMDGASAGGIDHYGGATIPFTIISNNNNCTSKSIGYGYRLSICPSTTDRKDDIVIDVRLYLQDSDVISNTTKKDISMQFN